MSETKYGVTSQGFVRKPLDVITTDLNSKFIATFGESFDTTPESPDGQVIGIISDKISELWGLAHGSYNAYRPGATEGIGLDNIVELNRVVRYVNTPTKVTCQLAGDSGLKVPAGSLVATTDGTYQFSIESDAILPATATAICTTLGEVAIPSNSVTKIITAIDGWASVNNAGAGLTGITYESDPQLRARREKSTIVTGTNTIEAIYSALYAMGLSYVRIRDNDDDTPIGSQPAHSFQVVVIGGSDTEIAKTIYENKPAGIKPYGTTTISVNDSKGYPHSVGFSRPVNTSVYIDVTINRLSGSSNDTIANIKSALEGYINTLPPGSTVVWSKLFTPITLISPQVEVESLTIGLSKDVKATSSLPMDITNKPYTEETFITITDVTDE